ncbi:MAG: hydroxyacylglutathione hydrolase [Burkholderiaceae bacterium]|nr:hydroxyacylglutathione hydrolase [Burkholderiaceae bacterium]
MKIAALPAFSDNYIWLVHDDRSAVVVDPGQAAPVVAALTQASLALAGILVTHHHGDHVGGVAELRDRFGAVPVWRPAGERLPFDPAPPCQHVQGGDVVTLLGQDWQVIDTPGHTAGHVAYLLQPPGQAPLLFCGDTLFSAGCGRLFEGSPAQMADSLQRLAGLPGETRVCCAHEYTLSNLRFAAAVEPDNAAVIHHRQHCETLRERGEATLPSTLALELQINPFLRCQAPAVQAAAAARGADPADPVAVLATLRHWKNEFR